MTKLETITADMSVIGLAGKDVVKVIAVKWYGPDAMNVTFRTTTGQVAEQILYRSDEERLSIEEANMSWNFKADANLFRLVSEAYRLNLAHVFDPYLAVRISSIEPLPHQISAVYQDMLPRLPLRYILADDPGAGKTIMTGLLLRELLVRGDTKRCLIVAPGNLVEQWQEELQSKFALRFEILSNDRIETAVTGNIFNEIDLCIARLDKLSRSEDLQAKLQASEWDIIICDEAHKMSASVWGDEVKYTKRFHLGRLLSDITRHFLLLTATPHNGKEEDFQLFMSLIDPDRFSGVTRNKTQSVDVTDIMRRLVKEDLRKFDGRPLFPERRASTVSYDLSYGENELYQEVTAYVREEFNRADKLSENRRNMIGFALTTLQRRLASSPEAIYQSLRRRRERLEHRLFEERSGRRLDEYSMPDIDDDDDLLNTEMEEVEEQVVDRATAAQTIAELEMEISLLKVLEAKAREVRMSGQDRKWEELSALLQDRVIMMDDQGQPEKLIIFTEHRDTLRYLTDKIRSLLGREEAVVNIHGAMSRQERHRSEEAFREDKYVRILVATDAAGEGINLQRAHLMVNYDLPWNPNRLEQRFGRIHRIGQTEVCHLWNLVAKETREGQVFERLFTKLEQEREALQGKVFDVLGKLTFENRSLRDLLIEAVRYGNDPEVRERLEKRIDQSIEQVNIQQLLKEHALAENTLDVHRLTAIREDMERWEARKLQPHFIEAFFKEAFALVGGGMHPREGGRSEISRVPNELRYYEKSGRTIQPLASRYERVCFDKDKISIPGLKPATLIAPGHPLLEAAVDIIRARYTDALKQGTIFIADGDHTEELRLLLYIEDAVQDGTTLVNGSKRIISKNLCFVEMNSDGKTINAGYAPYLDYRAPKSDELSLIESYIDQQDWLKVSIEDMAIDYAITTIIPKHLEEVRSRRLRLVEKTKRAVKARLITEIQYWDSRSVELSQREAEGKAIAKLNSQQARARADELMIRMDKRLDELEKESQVSSLPPLVVGGALVIPRELLDYLQEDNSTSATIEHNEQKDHNTTAEARKEVELAAMQAVMAIETSLGFTPIDVSASKVGYDIESGKMANQDQDMEAQRLRFIEVKGRSIGATTVTITKNEVLTALNIPDQYILALVQVDGGQTETVYLQRPFRNTLDFAATSVNFDIQDLLEQSEIILQLGRMNDNGV